MQKLNLDSYITLNNETVIFNLDSDIIEEVSTFSLEISLLLQTKLLSYFVDKQDHHCSLIFISYYQNQPVIKTVINTNNITFIYGNIINQGELVRKINLTHQILIEYVFKKMGFKEKLNKNLNLNLISGVISVIIVIISIGFNLSKFLSLNPLFFLFTILMGLLLQQGIKIILKIYVKKYM